jgi:hypothetical protein
MRADAKRGVVFRSRCRTGKNQPPRHETAGSVQVRRGQLVAAQKTMNASAFALRGDSSCRAGREPGSTLDSRPHPGARSWAPDRQSCKVQEQADGCRYRVPKVATQRPLRLEDLDRAARVSAFFAACVRAEALRLPGRPTMRRWPRADPCRLVRRQGRKQRCAAPGDRAMPRRQRTHPYPIRGMRPGRFRGRRRSLRWQTNRFA